ncbi:MAG: hypothetical protein ACI9EF_003323 [Pseudohongiellaceae bacterium]|jgi:hypothetical protein
MQSALWLIALLSCGLPACTTTRSPRQVATVVRQQKRAMDAHFAVGEALPGLRIARGIDQFDPDLADFAGRLAAAPAEIRQQFGHDQLGVNVALRRPEQSGVLARVAWWLPDRLLDLFDVLSFDVRLGYGLAGDLHLTQGAALAAGAAGGIGVGWHEQRSLGLRVGQYSGWRLGSDGAGFDWGFDAGTGERRIGGARREGGSYPEALIYQEWRDYWAVGVSAHVVLLGARLELHPVQLADFFGGWVGFDLGNDDQGGTRAVPLVGTSDIDLQTLRECLTDEPTMELWRGAMEAAQQLRQAPTSDNAP